MLFSRVEPHLSTTPFFVFVFALERLATTTYDLAPLQGQIHEHTDCVLALEMKEKARKRGQVREPLRETKADMVN